MADSPFTRLPPPPVDAIFAVSQEAKAAGPEAIDASVGMILSEEGKPIMFDCVRKATQDVMREKKDFSYPPLLGFGPFRDAAKKLVFGDSRLVASAAAAGGTGALALNLKILKLLSISTVVLPVPTWPNHRRLLQGFSMDLKEVPYLSGGKPDVRPLLEVLKARRDPAAVLLQAGCHNPTGMAFSGGQWNEISVYLSGTPHVLLLDFAYQGLGLLPEEDASPARTLRKAQVPLLVSWSASKNHSLYGLRTGLACAVAGDEKDIAKLEGHYKILLREMHSAAPSLGQEIVAAVQERYVAEWRKDLSSVRESLQGKRRALSEAVPEFAEALSGEGLFAKLPLSERQVLALRGRKVFLTGDGRINLGGISFARMEEFTEKLKSVIES